MHITHFGTVELHAATFEKRFTGQIKDFGVWFIVLCREVEQLDGSHANPHAGGLP